MASVDVPALLQQARLVEQPALYTWLRSLDDAYHNGESLVDDTVYDQVLKTYTERFGPYEVVGYLPKENKVDLPFPMASLDKVVSYEDEEETKKAAKALELWMAKYPSPYVFEDKIDGISALYYQNRLYTRGDGRIGMDVTQILDYLHLPVIENDIAVRGEIVMETIDFESYKREHPEASNPRNTAAGLVNSKTMDISGLRLLKFYAYQIVNSTLSPSEQIIELQKLGFNTPWVAQNGPVTIEYLDKLLRYRKEQSTYGIDGIVIWEDKYRPVDRYENPDNARAFKIAPPTALRRVIEVKWIPTKDRILFPDVYYEPFEYEGSILTKATGKHAQFIISSGIGPGALIRVTKGGEIIPDILEVLEPAEPQLPDFDANDYHWDRNQVHLVLNYDTDEVVAKRIEYFFNRLDILNVGPARIKALVGKGYNTIGKIIRASVADFAQLDRVGEKTAQTMWTSIHQGIQNVNLAALMAGSGVFGRGFSEKRAQLLLQYYPDLSELIRLPFEERQKLILAIDGFGPVLSQQTSAYLPAFLEWLQEHPEISYKIKEEEGEEGVTVAPDGALRGIKVVVTGFRGDTEFKRKVAELGGIYYDGAPTKRDASTSLVVASTGAGKNKIEKAREYGIPIMAREEFEARYFH